MFSRVHGVPGVPVITNEAMLDASPTMAVIGKRMAPKEEVGTRVPKYGSAMTASLRDTVVAAWDDEVSMCAREKKPIGSACALPL